MTEEKRTKAADEIFCGTCGAAIKIAAEICPKCGVRQKKAEMAKKRVTAALLAIFLGGIGVHKFYIGRKFAGFMHLLFCWTGVPAFLGLIEGIAYLVNSKDDEEFNGKYVPSK